MRRPSLYLNPLELALLDHVLSTPGIDHRNNLSMYNNTIITSDGNLSSALQMVRAKVRLALGVVEDDVLASNKKRVG